MAIDPLYLLRSTLIKAGIAGIRQRDLTHSMRNVATVDEYMPLLLKWKKKNLVQRFVILDKPNRPTTIWRATERLKEEL